MSLQTATNDELRRAWAAALQADVGAETRDDLGKQLVELAEEIDRRVRAGDRDLLRPHRPGLRPT
ncbi:hypothetical protein [Georgenia faecalis]|uniref:Uncharacterized protein n=1 Tax=Georgenia faecalis TaxID=2483799 RepID=A0ABV9D9D8_9MICO|nr:hypothetical protein [Georgenia faecalis]